MKRNYSFKTQNSITKSIEKFKFYRNIPAFLCVNLWLIFLCLSANAQTLAPGAPGKDAQWATAGKQAIGTSFNAESKVWFTLAEGALTEVYYPNVTMANVHLLQFVVVDAKTHNVETEREDTNHKIEVVKADSLTFRQHNKAKNGSWEILKTYTVDTERNSILIAITFKPRKANLELYVYYDPSLNNTGMHDTAWTQGNSFLASEGDKASALICETIHCDFNEMTNGFLGINDGIEQLKNNGKITAQYSRAENGNVVQVARLNSKMHINNFELFQLSLGFGKTSEEALQTATLSARKGFAKNNEEYDKGWSDYVKTIPKVEAKYQAQFNMAAMVLKAQEDKTVAGANVASLTIPWGGGANANEDIGGGYHLVWSRDLYQVVTAYMALGDTAAANRALDFLFNIQQKPDGSFPQNSWLDGKQGWGSLQLDEVAYPLIMAYQLKRFDKKTYENHVKKAADFLVKTGPKTPQERWEEKSGYSPSTIAAEIAGLVCAADIARRNGDETSATLYLKTADDWAANVEKWTATTNGKYGDGNYYVRLTENGKPDEKEKTILSNNAGTAIENEIVDAGFLELVRLGIKSPDDPLIQKSIKVIDQTLRVATPNGESFYRYTNDGYGEMDDGRRWNWDGKYTGKGRLWALLAGERGQYEIARSDYARNYEKFNSQVTRGEYISGWKTKAQTRLDAMANFANESLMIAEQIWDKPETPKNIDKQFVPELKFGEGTGSATPLAWSMAQFIRLAVNLQAGKNLDTPDIVYNRYVKDKKVADSSQITDPLITQKNIDNLPQKNKAVIRKEVEEANKKVEISTSCYGEWWDKNKEKVLKQSPIIIKCKDGSSLPIFVYSGKGENVEVVGDFTGWKPQKLILTRYQPYAPVEGDFLEFSRFYALENISSSARVEYKLIVDGKWITDPLNPKKVDNGVGGENSFFEMPSYQPTSWDKRIDGLPTTIETLDIDSKIYGKRTVQIYKPFFKPDGPKVLPVLYFQDGADYINRAKAVQIQQNLVRAGKIQPFIMVFIDYKDRMKEYWASDDYAKFLATEVVPAIDAKYHTSKSRDGRAILGASLGGVTSVHTAIKYPEIFGRVGGQSSSFWIDNQRVLKELDQLNLEKNTFKFYFDTGTLEGADNNRKAVEILRKKGFDVTYEEREVGHNWTAWRDRLADAFTGLWK